MDRPQMTLEAAQDFKQTRAWTLICNEIDLLIESIEVRLRSCTPEELTRLQTKIEALEELKALPDAIIHREE